MRVHNFGAGPCTLPEEVLREAQSEMVEFGDSGMSIIEMSHRSPAYQAVHDETRRLLREVSGAPDDFDILFIQGGATLQFGMVPMNLAYGAGRVGYVVSGAWAKKALAEAGKVADAYAAWDGTGDGFRRMPDADEIRVEPGTRYVHVTTNETIDGLRLEPIPDLGVPLVADVSSEYLSRPLPWERFDLVYGGVQKNLGPAGMAVVFIRSAALPGREDLPNYLRYAWHATAGSLGNTPPMFSIYVMGKVLRRIAALGGVAALEKLSAAKADLVYGVIDASDGFYANRVHRRNRSHMNVVFRLPTEALEAEFVAESASAGLVGLKGHRSVGGCRASLYAGLEMSSAEALATFMEGFRQSH